MRIVSKINPKYVVWENVKNVTGKKNIHNFEKYLEALEELGYNNYWKVLNAKDYGVAQNRERVFVISIRNDIDSGKFDFPKPFALEYVIENYLDDVVDEKYYINTEKAQQLIDDLLERGELVG